MAVVLPAPFGPTSANTAPSGTSSVSPRSASTWRKFLASLRCAMGCSSFVPPRAPASRRQCSSMAACSSATVRPSFLASTVNCSTSCPSSRARSLRRSGRRLQHHRADARPHLQQPFGGQLSDDFVRRVGMNLHGFAQGANRRERVARPKLAGDHGLLGGKRHLFVHRNARLRIELKRNHRRLPAWPNAACITTVLCHMLQWNARANWAREAGSVARRRHRGDRRPVHTPNDGAAELPTGVSASPRAAVCSAWPSAIDWRGRASAHLSR